MLRDAAKIDITNLQTCLLQKKKKAPRDRDTAFKHVATSAAHSKHLPDGSKSFRPRRDSNSQSSDPKSDALSIRPRDHGNTNP